MRGGDNTLSYLNSKELFLENVKNGETYIEVDFLFTSDKHIVCSHYFEFFDSYSFQHRPSLEVFENQLLAGKYHGMTYDWLLEQLQIYPNVRIIFDTKEKNSIALLEEMTYLAQQKNIDISSRFIIQVYSEKNYYTIKANSSLYFQIFWYTNYKSMYNYARLKQFVESKNDIESVVFHYADWWAYWQSGYTINKKIAVHTIQYASSVRFLSKRGVNFIFADHVLL